MEWRSGDRVFVRAAAWQVLRSTAYSDCQALDLEASPPGTTRTLLVPFDRPRTPPHPPLAVVSRRRWAHEVRRAVLPSFPYGGLRQCPASVRLLAYQLEPALAILRHGATRVLVADDVGLGKTVEAGLVVLELARRDRSARILILCPAALRAQWATELARLFGLEAIDADAGWLRRMTRELPAETNPWSLPGVYLASIDFVKRPEALRPLEGLRWDLLVVDEAHVATRGSDRRVAVDALATRSRHLLLLTATPHHGDDEAFRALCALGCGGDAGLVLFSRDRSETPLGPSPRRSRVLAVRPSHEERDMHRRLAAYTRRLWTESDRRRDPALRLLATVLAKRALSSPASLALSVRRRAALLAGVPLSPSQVLLPLDADPGEDDVAEAVLGVKGLGSSREEAHLLEGIGEAADTAAGAERKVQALLRLVRRAGEPALVFSEYRDTAARLCRILNEAGQHAALLHGGLPDTERARAVAALASGRSHLVATDAASEGLNLHQACRLVVHVELPWTPTRLRQRSGRVDRIGQTRRVHEIALVACDTSEQLVLGPLLARASRTGPFMRSALVERLGESEVAAHVLGGRPVVASALRLPTDTVRMDLRAEAQAEVRRLERLRGLDIAGSRDPAPPRRRSIVPIAAIDARHPHVPPGLHLVFLIRLRDATGATLAQEVVVLSRDLPPGRRRGGDALRGLVRDAVAQTGGFGDVIGRLVAEQVRDVRPLREACVRRLLQREQHAARHLRSPAEELVQAGLFDRRALRAAAARRETRAARLECEEARLATLAGDASIEGTHELLAALVRWRP